MNYVHFNLLSPIHLVALLITSGPSPITTREHIQMVIVTLRTSLSTMPQDLPPSNACHRYVFVELAQVHTTSPLEHYV